MSDDASTGDDVDLNMHPTVNFNVGISERVKRDGRFSYFSSSPDPNHLPPGRTLTVCILGFPTQLTLPAFLNQIASYVDNVSEIVFGRTGANHHDRVMIITFDAQEAADRFYSAYNQRRVASVEGMFYNMVFAATFDFDRSMSPPPCTICNEIICSSSCGVLTISCDHTFHIRCMTRWAEIYCPTCRCELHEVPRVSSFTLRLARYMATCRFLMKLFSIIGDVSRVSTQLIKIRELIMEVFQTLASIFYKISDLFRFFK